TPCFPGDAPSSPVPAHESVIAPTASTLSWNDTPTRKVVYGDDNRLDVFQVGDPEILAAYESTVVLVRPDRIEENGDGTWTLENDPWVTQEGMPICEDEPFRGQPNPGFCSGFLVGPDLVVTAGHCIVGEISCADSVFVFGFGMNGPDDPILTVPDANVYFCAEILDRAFGGEDRSDWALIRLDRPVEGRDPLRIRRNGKLGDGDDLLMIGYPSGLPAKIAGGAHVRSNTESAYFVANTDSSGGNSGSVVLNAETLKVEGILVRGEIDFENVGGCRASKECPDDGCRGEDVTRISEVSGLIPFLERYDVYFGECGHLEFVGTSEDTSWPINCLKENTSYCWRVDAVNDCSTTQ
ncbi:MAG: trypsin-like peptidase domain-containing protein, partial [Candidatus Omnitrophica bacterium]|nr:trypsin-like peptidase domain-containing protein [Candidatus Omnitrophota bacterium]